MKNTPNLEACDKIAVVQTELEMLTGRIYSGDATSLVYDLFKDSKDLEGLLQYLTGEVNKENVCISETATVNNQDCDSRPCFSKWISQFQQLQ